MRLRRALRSTTALLMAFGGIGLMTATPAVADPYGLYGTAAPRGQQAPLSAHTPHWPLSVGSSFRVHHLLVQ
ncbi:hypothetical protein GCM10020229_35920 [Kitasatospora albolonga]